MTKKDQIRQEYINRINKVIDFVENNLDKDLPLELVSKNACFSPFHFHRIFSTITGETVKTFITRKRIEKIASILLAGNVDSITNLAYENGFKDLSSFSRAFKKFYGMSATEFQEKGKDKFSKICKTESKNCKEKITFENYICSINKLKNWINMNAEIKVKEMPELKIAYIRHVGDFNKIGAVYERLFRWAGPKGLLNFPETKTITVYHDDPKVTEISKVRQSAGITLEREIASDGEVGTMTIPKGKFAVGRFEIGVEEFEKAWNSMCVWVAENDYKSRDGNYYELYYNDHTHHPERKFILDICVPVE